MRVITKRRLEQFYKEHNDAKTPLERWYLIVCKAKWKSFDDLKKIFSSADQVKVGSRNIVTVFNIAGNKYRLIAAIHYNAGRLYVLDIMTHEEYENDRWKDKF
jgi:mRNA interferase HigB